MTSSPTSTAAPGPSFSPAACTTSAFGELTPYIRHASSSTLAELLAANHESHHCFFNTRGMHNHSLHQLVADLTLGGSPEQLQRHYAYQIQHYLGQFSLNDRSRYDPYSPSDGGKGIQKVTEANWREHVGNARYYWSYLHFFDAQVQQRGLLSVLDRFVFSREANEEGVHMMLRFYGGVLHALIHFGYALEMRLPGIAAEALAMATSTAAGHAWLFDYQWVFHPPPPSKGGTKGLLELVREMQRDKRLSVEALGLKEEEAALPDTPFATREGSGFGVIQEYVDRWAAVQLGKEGEEEAMGELALLSGLLLGSVPKQTDGVAYMHDFFLMHLNNAHLFTPLYLHLFSSSSSSAHLSRAFLRALVAQFLYYYIARGRPALSLANFHDAEHDGHPPALSWETMFAQARDNVDEHLPKAVRALYVFEARYSGLQSKLRGSGLFDDDDDDDNDNDKGRGDGESIWRMTATQLVRMHRGELQTSRYASQEQRRNGESVGAHQEFWSFNPFF
ncbi:hypothetical protein EX895_002591 [Sporisorium graminicola]|uniref:Uncharacterized protein n=1 Tax=Sporisorium graminicola TaxID=280036 RepID=A0A4U7L0A7_9BASI|nr:hypothetical protein EX895_002591 [Sporisorium graminicola]TKY88602.1 hypothetical protein EX895_002591 [Sporisorium graminicola]